MLALVTAGVFSRNSRAISWICREMGAIKETHPTLRVPGVFAGLSIHLQPARVNPPKMNHPDEMYVDLGATGAADVHAAGVDLLDPIALQRKWFPVGQGGEAGAAAGDRFGCTVLSQLLERIKDAKAKGTTTVAFLTQQWTGGRGLNCLLEETKPDEMIFVGRMATGGKSVARAGTAALTPGDGVLLGVEDASAPPAGTWLPWAIRTKVTSAQTSGGVSVCRL